MGFGLAMLFALVAIIIAIVTFEDSPYAMFFWLVIAVVSTGIFLVLTIPTSGAL